MFRWQSLLDAPALVVVLTRPDAYVERYSEADKARDRLGESLDGWPVPFWWVDAGAVIENLLLLVTAAGLGACLFGLFEHEAAVLSAFGVPSEYRAAGTIAIGRPLDERTGPSQDGRSARRGRPPIADLIHRGRW
ncbi:MAG: nitroreductase family protein [Acidimicrobiales bacterium]